MVRKKSNKKSSNKTDKTIFSFNEFCLLVENEAEEMTVDG